MRRSGISPLTLLRLAGRFAPHPWIWGKLALLQAEKYGLALRPGRLRSGQAGKIRQLSIRLTDLCNLRCATCGQWGERGFLHGRNLRELRKDEIPVARHVEVMTDMVRRGHRPPVYLWGGEPMLYEGVVELIQACTRLRLPVSIATNGTGIAAAAEALVNAPLFLLQISIDGHTAEVHNRLRPALGGGDNFADIAQALAAVRETRRRQRRSLPLIASLTTISHGNATSLVDLYETFRDRVELFVFYLSWWIDEKSAVLHTADFSDRFGFEPTLHRGWVGGWRPDNYVALAQQLQELKRRARRPGAPPVVILPDVGGTRQLEAYYTDHAETFGYRQCVSIMQAVEIDSNGDLSPCRDYHDYSVGNIRDQFIPDLWNNEKYRHFRQSLACDGLMPACRRCCGLMGF